jgi:outer membrane PBP1 activator LpoA protein
MLAQRAFRDGLRRIGIVGIPTPLSRRTREAFVAEWRQLGGDASVTLEAQPNSDLTQMRSMLTERTLDGVFLSAQYQEARMIRPYLPVQIPVYATSQVNIFPPDPVGMVDLNGVRFIDMPWLLSQDHPSVASFPRPMDLSGDALRFYALGVDAYLIANQLVDGQNRFDLDGLTGRISVYPDGTIERRPWAAVFQDGVPTLIE